MIEKVEQGIVYSVNFKEKML